MQVLIADNQPQVRFALRVALEQRPGMKTIGEAIDAEDLLAQAKATRPNLVLLDSDLAGIPLADLIARLHQICNNVHTIVLSSRDEERERALAAGADAFVCKCDAPDELLSAIDDSFKEEFPVDDKQPGQARLEA
jgi:DNA-binding NarL/FixJ family response regulator